MYLILMPWNLNFLFMRKLFFTAFPKLLILFGFKNMPDPVSKFVIKISYS